MTPTLPPAPDPTKLPAGRPRGRGWAMTGLLFLLAVALCGGYVLYAWAQTVTRSEQVVLDGPVTGVAVTGGTTDVRVRPGPAGAPSTLDVRLTDRAGQARWTHRLEEDRLQVRSGCAARWIANFCSVEIVLTVPADTPLQVHTATGDLDVEQMRDVQATASTGDLTLRGLTGTLRATTSPGRITAEQLDVEQVTARTSTGDIRLQHRVPPSQLDAEASTGDITVRLPRDGGGYRVEASSGTGQVLTDVTHSPTAERVLRAETSTGSVTIG